MGTHKIIIEIDFPRVDNFPDFLKSVKNAILFNWDIKIESIKLVEEGAP